MDKKKFTIKDFKKLQLTPSDLEGEYRVFNEVKIYPTKVKDMGVLFYSIDFLNYRKNWYKAIPEVHKLDYLGFLEKLLLGKLKELVNNCPVYENKQEGDFIKAKDKYKYLREIPEEKEIQNMFNCFISLHLRDNQKFSLIEDNGIFFALFVNEEGKEIKMNSNKFLEFIYNCLQINGIQYDFELAYDLFSRIKVNERLEMKKVDEKMTAFDLIILYKILFKHEDYSTILNKNLLAFDLELKKGRELIDTMYYSPLLPYKEKDSKLPYYFNPIEKEINYKDMFMDMNTVNKKLN